MKNKKTVLWFAVMVMAIIPVYAQQYDTSLNGTWKDKDGYIIIRDSGNWEAIEDGIPYTKGTYTTSNGKYTYTRTYIFGAVHGLGARWYSKAELGKDNYKLFEPRTQKYIINGNKLTFTYDDGETYTETLVSRDVKFIQDINYSSGSVSTFPGRWHLIKGKFVDDDDIREFEDFELFKDGTGTANGYGFTWKIENGRFHILHPFVSFSAYYNVIDSGSTLILTRDDRHIATYKKK